MKLPVVALPLMPEAEVGKAQILERLSVPSGNSRETVKGVVLLRTHDDIGRVCTAGEVKLSAAGGFLEIHDGVIVCVLVLLLGERIYPIYLDALQPETSRALKQIARQGYLVLGAIFGGEQLPFVKYRLPPGNMFRIFANPPRDLKRWTPAQFARAAEAVKQAFDGDIEGLLDSMYPKRSLAELRFGMNLQADNPLH